MEFGLEGIMFAKPPLEIPGTGIRPPDKSGGRCPNSKCRRIVIVPIPKRDPQTKKIRLYCPYCGTKLK